MPSTAEDGLSTSEEIVFYCFPMLDGIVDPHTVVVDVEWWVEDQLVIEESFNLKAKSSGILQPQFWKMGQTVSCFFKGSLIQDLILCLLNACTNVFVSVPYKYRYAVNTDVHCMQMFRQFGLFIL